MTIRHPAWRTVRAEVPAGAEAIVLRRSREQRFRLIIALAGALRAAALQWGPGAGAVICDRQLGYTCDMNVRMCH